MRNLGVLAKYETEDGVVTLTRARVHGEVMVVKHVRSLHCGEDTGRGSHDTHDARDILSEISCVAPCPSATAHFHRTVEKSHPNLVQLYGRSTGTATTRFTVLRSGKPFCKMVCIADFDDTTGVHIAAEYLRATYGADESLMRSAAYNMVC